MARVVIQKAQEGHHERADGCGARLFVGFVMRFGLRGFAGNFRATDEVRQSNRGGDDDGAEGAGDEESGGAGGPERSVTTEPSAAMKMNADDGDEEDGLLFVDEEIEQVSRG